MASGRSSLAATHLGCGVSRQAGGLVGCSVSERWEEAVVRPRPEGGAGIEGMCRGQGRERKAAAIERRLKEEERGEED